MVRRGFSVGFAWALAATIAGLAVVPSVARADEDARTVSKFLQGLRDRGYYDLAADYLEQLRAQSDAPAEVIDVIDYELGRITLDEASRTGDLVRRKELLDQARGRLDAFTKAHPTHAKAPEALVQVARLLVERGHLAMLQADETEVKAEKEAKLAEARTSFDQARAAYESADKNLTAAFAKFPRFIPDGDPRKEERDRTHNSLMEAQLQKAVVDYEQGQSYPLKSKERTDLMSRALTQFEELYKKYRTQFAGLTARMWSAKCFEERGDLGPAMGIYNELLEHGDPRLRPLQRHVGYFKIIVLGKRGEHALAADEAVRWLQANNNTDAQRSKEGLGVQLELAKNLIAQLPEVKSESEKGAAVKRATDVLGNVVRFASPFKTEAIALLKKYKPSAAVRATDVARLNYEDAVSQGEQAIASHEWDRAAALMKQAIRRAETAHDVDKTNYARYNLAFIYYTDKKYYEAAVLADHLARRYPQGGLSAKAAEIGMASIAEAYNLYTQIDRTADLNNLLETARYTAETFADRDQGDTAKMTLGQIYHGTGRYSQAIEAYDSVRPKSARWVEAQTRLGASRWEQSQALRRSGKAAEADAEVAKAIACLEAALKARHDAGSPATDAGLIGNACDLAEIYLETGKAPEALKLLDPIAKGQTGAPGPAFGRLTATMLRAHISTSQVDLAMADMTALEKAGDSEGLTQLYYGLGKLLEKEMDALRKKGDTRGLERTKQAYLKFLNALVASKSGQTYESLQWAGENMLTLGNPKAAHDVFEQVLKTYDNEKFLAQPGGPEKILRTRIKLAASLRDQRNFGEAESMVSQLLEKYPKTIEVLMEKGMLEEDKAAAGKGSWNSALTQWRNTAMRLGAARTKPLEYFEAWYHVAVVLNSSGKPKEAKQALASIMKLSPAVGGPEMKDKYKKLFDQIK
jgi:tetratricopeptide (TPR) repeat protein